MNKKIACLFFALCGFLFFSGLNAQQTKRVFMIGNSVTDGVNYAGFKALAEDPSGPGNTHIWARHMIPGSPLFLLWEARNGSGGFTESPYGYPTDAFVNYQWDAITLQPFDRHLVDGSGASDEGDVAQCTNYANLAKTVSPNVQFYILGRYPRAANSNNDPANDPASTAELWNTLHTRTYTGGWDGTNETRDYYEKLTDACTTANSTLAKPFRIIPLGEVMYSLNNKMMAGQVPGYTRIWQLYADGIHLNLTGSYLNACTFYATIYKESPVGRVVPSQYGAINPAVALIIQQTAWEVVSTYPQAGIFGEVVVPVSAVSVQPTDISVAVNQTFQLTPSVAPGNASNQNVSWSSSDNTVATVSSTGVITGKLVGTADITLTSSADASITSTCAVTVVSDPIAVSGLTVSPASLNIKRGNSSPLMVSVLPINATNQAVVWSSGDPSKAVVDANGVVSALADGTVDIIATSAADPLKTAKTALTVLPNAAPVAVITASKVSGLAPLVVNFSSASSADSDEDDYVLGFEWDFGDNTAIEKSSSPSHTFTTAGTYTVKLRVMDNNNLYGSIVSETITVTAGLSGVSLAAWDFANWNPAKETRTTAPVTTNHTSLTVSTLVLGAGIDSSPNYFSNSMFGGTGSGSSAKTLAEAISKNEYFEFTLTPVSGKSLAVYSINICPLTQGVVRDFSLFSSLKGYSAADEISKITTVAGTEFNIEPQTFTVTGHAELNTAVTFRIYTYGQDAIDWKPIAIGFRKAPAVADLQVNGEITAPDNNPPTMPGSLTATSVGANSLKLTWEISTDDNEVAGYDVYNGETLLGSTTTQLFYSAAGLSPETSYTFKVIAKDLSGKTSTPAVVSVTTAVAGTAGDVPKLPIGMNIPGLSYYTTSLVFTDAMAMSGDFMSWYDDGGWSSNTMSEIPRDMNGYPTQVPFLTSDGKQTKVRVMLNPYYNGRYVLTCDGEGTLDIGGIPYQKVSSNKYYIDFNGSGSNAWLNITQSTSGNYLKNIKILPLIYENSSTYPTFNPKYLEGLRPFHAFRFMDWINTNNSKLKYWNQRPTKTYYSQATELGASFEYAIELCNELDVDAWVTVPHQADDDFIIQTARLWRDGLRPNRKIYAEYSNEIWNWMFTQASYCLNNAPQHPNSYVTAGLNAISAPGIDHPEKDAYMMARTLRLWKAEFSGTYTARLVRVAAVQHGWTDNTRRVLNYLFDVDKGGCDVVSPGGYFNFGEADHNAWLERCGTDNQVTADEVCQGASTYFDTNESKFTDETAAFANARGVGYIVYEGGQHMQPWMQGEWCYNQAVYDAQISPKMYDLYMKNFRKMTDPKVNCSLFMAFAYMGQRQSKYGSWGHLENLEQIGSVSNYMTIAPKYQALLDATTAKTPGLTVDISQNMLNKDEMIVYPNPASGELTIDFGSRVENALISILDMQGRRIMTATVTHKQTETLRVADLKSGIYFVTAVSNGKVMKSKFVKK